jgi:hypothetical protein
LEVDAVKARLVTMIPPGGGEADNILLAGGHRLWLGPQTEWPRFWPPPADWEQSAATTIGLSPDGTELTLDLPRHDKRFPPLTRAYRLAQDSLELVGRWEADDTASGRPAFQAIHILQTRADTQVLLRATPSPSTPLGYGLLALSNRPGTLIDRPLPEQMIVQGNVHPAFPRSHQMRLRGTGLEEKVGVVAQPIEALFHDTHRLRLEPLQHNGEIDETPPLPDAGLYTQVYFGAAKWAMTELEQLSPRLRPAPGASSVETRVTIKFVVAAERP